MLGGEFAEVDASPASLSEKLPPNISVSIDSLVEVGLGSINPMEHVDAQQHQHHGKRGEFRRRTRESCCAADLCKCSCSCPSIGLCITLGGSSDMTVARYSCHKFAHGAGLGNTSSTGAALQGARLRYNACIEMQCS